MRAKNTTDMDIQQLEAIMTHNYFLGVYGAILFWLVQFSVYREKIKRELIAGHEKPTIKKVIHRYFDEYWDEMVITLAVTPLLVVFDDEILAGFAKWQEIEDPGEFHQVVYISAGVVTMLLIKLVQWLNSKWKHE